MRTGRVYPPFKLKHMLLHGFELVAQARENAQRASLEAEHGALHATDGRYKPLHVRCAILGEHVAVVHVELLADQGRHVQEGSVRLLPERGA